MTMPSKLRDYSKQRAEEPCTSLSKSQHARINISSGSSSSSLSLFSKDSNDSSRSGRKNRLSINHAVNVAQKLLAEPQSGPSLVTIPTPQASCGPRMMCEDDSCSTHDTMCYLPKGSLHSMRRTMSAPSKKDNNPKLALMLTDKLLGLSDSTFSLLTESESTDLMDESQQTCDSCLDGSDSTNDSNDSSSSSSSSSSDEDDDISVSSSSSSSSSDDDDDEISIALSELSDGDHTSMTRSLSCGDDHCSNHDSVCFSLRRKKTNDASTSSCGAAIPSAIRLQRSLSKLNTASDDNDCKRMSLRRARSMGKGSYRDLMQPGGSEHKLRQSCFRRSKSAVTSRCCDKNCCEEGFLKTLSGTCKKQVGKETKGRNPLVPLVNAMAIPRPASKMNPKPTGRKGSSLNNLMSALDLSQADINDDASYCPPPPGPPARSQSAGASLGALMDQVAARQLIGKCQNSFHSSKSGQLNTLDSHALTRSDTNESVQSTSTSKYSDMDRSDRMGASISNLTDNTNAASGERKRPTPTRVTSLGTLAMLMKQENSSRSIRSSNSRPRLSRTKSLDDSGHAPRAPPARRSLSRCHSSDGSKPLNGSSSSLLTLGRMVRENSNQSLRARTTHDSTTSSRRANRRHMRRSDSSLSTASGRSTGSGRERRTARRRLKKSLSPQNNFQGSTKSLTALMDDQSDAERSLRSRTRRKSATSLSNLDPRHGMDASASNASASLFVTGSRIRRLSIMG